MHYRKTVSDAQYKLCHDSGGQGLISDLGFLLDPTWIFVSCAMENMAKIFPMLLNLSPLHHWTIFIHRLSLKCEMDRCACW